MSNCRITDIKPECGYREDGITDIQLLDFDDFEGFRFDNDELYPNCYVIDILRNGYPINVDTPDTANYGSTLNNGLYTHTIETFITDLSAELSAMLHLATKRRHVALFKTKNGRSFVFGYEAGATVTYTNQTTDGLGSLLTIKATSIYPLFEYLVSSELCRWTDFINIWREVTINTTCHWGNYINVWEYRAPVVTCTWKDFINIWERARAYSRGYSRGYA